MASNTKRRPPITKQTIELEGDAPPEELHDTIEELSSQNSIRSIQIEVEPGTDLSLATQQDASVESETDEEQPDDDHDEDDLSDLEWTELVSVASDHNLFKRGKDRDELEQDIRDARKGDITTETDHPDHDRDDTTQDVPRLHSDGNPHKILSQLDDTDGWIRTKNLKEMVPDQLDVSEDTLPTNLHNLEERDLVSKRDYEDDKRQNEYKITDLGRTVLEQTEQTA